MGRWSHLDADERCRAGAFPLPLLRWRVPALATKVPRKYSMAQIRKDRFIGQYGDVNGGWLLSREVKVTGNRLLVNIAPEHRAWNHQHHGYVKVELLDRHGGVYSYQHLPGFGQDDCAQLRANEYEMVVSWKGSPDIWSLRGKAVYIRFWLQSAYLFGFRFTDG